MAPSAHSEAQNAPETHDPEATRSRNSAPLRPSGALDAFEFEETTPVIGREFPSLNIVNDILHAPNADQLLRDLAITISRRGVVFLRAQHNLTNDLQKSLIHNLGIMSGKPTTSTLHIHPIINDMREFGAETADAEISTISSIHRKRLFDHNRQKYKRKYDSARWHSDIQFETCPADYTSLRLTELPSTGGDTLFASGYELYDRFSKPYQTFLEGLSATFVGDGFIKAAESKDFLLYDKPRGSPANFGGHLTAIHPVVRTNPVTGWKSIYGAGTFPKFINELNAEESDELLKRFTSMIVDSHDLQVRFKWRNKNDLAIWDNRSAFHCATFDYEGLGERFGNRVVGIGEKPYLDHHSSSRSQDLEAAQSQRKAVIT